MLYLIDGNNLLGSWGGPGGSADRRLEVVARVAAYCRGHGLDFVLVFDGRPFRVEPGMPVVFPESGRDADGVIRDVVDRASKPAEIVVVTSDKPLYSYAKTRGAAVLRAHEWNAAERANRGSC